MKPIGVTYFKLWHKTCKQHLTLLGPHNQCSINNFNCKERWAIPHVNFSATLKVINFGSVSYKIGRKSRYFYHRALAHKCSAILVVLWIWRVQNVLDRVLIWETTPKPKRHMRPVEILSKPLTFKLWIWTVLTIFHCFPSFHAFSG